MGPFFVTTEKKTVLFIVLKNKPVKTVTQTLPLIFFYL
jgi:hypothetical protein